MALWIPPHSHDMVTHNVRPFPPSAFMAFQAPQGYSILYSPVVKVGLAADCDTHNPVAGDYRNVLTVGETR